MRAPPKLANTAFLLLTRHLSEHALGGSLLRPLGPLRHGALLSPPRDRPPSARRPSARWSRTAGRFAPRTAGRRQL